MKGAHRNYTDPAILDIQDRVILIAMIDFIIFGCPK